MFAYREDAIQYAERQVPFFKENAAQELEVYTKIERIVEWKRDKENKECPFSSAEIKKIAEDLIEVNLFRYGGDFEKFRDSSDYRMGRMAAMGNMTGYATEELILELYELAGLLEDTS